MRYGMTTAYNKRSKDTQNTKKHLTDAQLMHKYRGKFITDTSKDKHMGGIFWFMLGASIALLAFILTIVIIRNV